MTEDGIGHWVSKDRFAAKRLHALAADLDGPKRRIIEEQSAFRALLNVSQFNIPNALIDFVASHTSPGLREFKFHKKRIVFTKDMVRKVFGIRCGDRLVVQKKGEHPELRQMYIEEGQSRPFIQHAVKLLKACDVTDDLTIIRTWDLLCLATVIDPGSANLLSLDYLDCMLDPRRTHEFAWDEHLLELAMQEVTKITSKTVEVVYMDHLDFPPNQHVINYSIPRVCFVTSSDFKFVVQNDADRKILNNKTVFGRRPVPAAYKHLYEKHRSIYGLDVDTTLKNFGVGLKQMHSQRMAALLIDIDAAMKEGDGPSVHFPTGGGVEDENMDGADGREDEGTANEADEEIPEADSEGTDNDEFVVEASAADMGTHTHTCRRYAPISCSVGFFYRWDPDVIVVSEQHITIPAEEITLPADFASIVKLDDTHVVTKDASTGAKTVEKKTRHKRAAKGELSPPKLKKIKVSQDVVRKYDKYVSHGRKFKRKKKNEVA
ncbi:hypothetical protein ACQ4PT_053320 [Festuca glaucescens]